MASKRIPYPDTKTLLWLNHLMTEKIKSGSEYYRELIALGLWFTVERCDGVVPIGMERPDDMRHTEVWPVIEELVSNSGNAEDKKMNTAMAFLNFKLVEYVDTPIWIRLSDDLSTMLALTDLKGVKNTDVKMPFPSFVIGIPAGLLTWVYEFQDSGETDMEVRAVIVAKTKRIVVSRNAVESSGLSDDTVATLLEAEGREIDAVSCVALSFPRGTPTLNLDETFGVPVQFAPFAFITDSRIELTVDRCLMPSYWSIPEVVKMSRGGEKARPGYIEEAVLQLIVNTLLYVTARGDLKEKSGGTGSKKKKLKKREAARVLASRWNQWVVGSTVKLARSDAGEMQKAISSRSLTYAHLRRGHWRNQAHGPGRSLRTLKWIEPMIVRKDLGKVFGHEYEE